MENIFYITTGEVKVVSGINNIIEINGIGSCISLIIANFNLKICGAAHIMLPGKSFNSINKPNKTDFRYAWNAIEELINLLNIYSSDFFQKKIVVSVAGGGNVLKRKNDSISNENISSVFYLLQEKNIPVDAYSVGGCERRTILVSLKDEKIYYTLADSGQQTLFSEKDNICIREFIQTL